MKLSNWDLLSKRLLGATQNQNESLNSVLWSKASKTQFLSKPTTAPAVNLAILIFNEGMEVQLTRKLGIQSGRQLINFCKAADHHRLVRSESKAQVVAKQRRQVKAKNWAAEQSRERVLPMEPVSSEVAV